jgi:tryptophanyl-tRNA synthetase
LLYCSDITLNELKAIYGRELELSEAISGLTMVSDIVEPFHDDVSAVLVTLGIDEINHFSLTRELAKRTAGVSRCPAITYHRMITGLMGSKMGKSLPKNSVRLDEDPGELRAKLDASAPPPSLEGNWAWDVLRWFAEDDASLSEIQSTKSIERASRLAHMRACELVPALIARHQSAARATFMKARDLAESLLNESPVYRCRSETS